MNRFAHSAGPFLWPARLILTAGPVGVSARRVRAEGRKEGKEEKEGRKEGRKEGWMERKEEKETNA